MSPRFVLGLDPGRYGGYALLDQDHELFSWGEMPTMPSHQAGQVEIDPRELRSILRDYLAPAHVFLELVGPVHPSSLKSAFTFGRFFETLVTLCKLEGWSYTLVNPKVWQKEILPGLPRTKQASLAWANRAFPQLQLTSKQDGIAEACCIAEYGFRNFFRPSSTKVS